MNILVVQTGFLGDVILSSALYPNLFKLYPDARISVLTTPQARDLVSEDPLIEDVLVFDKRGEERGVGGLLRCAQRLRKRSFDIVFSLHKSYRTAGLLWLAGIRRRYGFREAALNIFYSGCASRGDGSHEVLRNLSILKNIGKNPSELEQKLRLFYSEEDRERAKQILSGLAHPIGIAPGSVWRTKRWTEEGFCELLEMLTVRGYTPVLLGGPNDLEVSRAMEHIPGVLNLVAQTSLRESAAIIAQLPLLVSNDSAPLHIASAVGTPVVALFCATVPEFGYGPWGVSSVIVQVENLECRPCGRHGGHDCPTGTHACRKNLSAHQVLRACEKLLE